MKKLRGKGYGWFAHVGVNVIECCQLARLRVGQSDL